MKGKKSKLNIHVDKVGFIIQVNDAGKYLDPFFLYFSQLIFFHFSKMNGEALVNFMAHSRRMQLVFLNSTQVFFLPVFKHCPGVGGFRPWHIFFVGFLSTLGLLLILSLWFSFPFSGCGPLSFLMLSKLFLLHKEVCSCILTLSE